MLFIVLKPHSQTVFRMGTNVLFKGYVVRTIAEARMERKNSLICYNITMWLLDSIQDAAYYSKTDIFYISNLRLKSYLIYDMEQYYFQYFCVTISEEASVI